MIEHGARKPDLCRKLLLVAVLAAFCQPNVAQSQAAPQAAKAAAKVPEFEVASIKPNASGVRMQRVMFTPDGFSRLTSRWTFSFRTHTEFHGT